MNDDIDRWVATLAGRDDDGPLDAAQLRSALRDLPPDDEVAIARELAALDNDRTADLLARARKDPVLANALARRPERRGARWPAIAAVLVVGIAVAWFTRLPGPGDAGEPPVVRASPGEIQRLEASDPPRLRDALASELRETGIDVRTYERFGRAGLDADLPDPVPPALEALLDRYRLALPADGVLRVEIVLAEEP